MALLVVISFALLLSAVSAQYGGYARPGYGHGGYAAPEPYDHPHYSFQYAVNDPHTYDIKSQQEERDGDYVHGSYSLVEPDGSHRTVEYADNGYGFQATVHRSGYTAHPAPAHAYHAPAYHAPAYRRY